MGKIMKNGRNTAGTLKSLLRIRPYFRERPEEVQIFRLVNQKKNVRRYEPDAIQEQQIKRRYCEGHEGRFPQRHQD
jgi:hypothetical protein